MLQKNIIIEYVLVVGILLLLLVVIPRLIIKQIDKGPKGIDGLGNAIAFVMLMNLINMVLPFIFLVANPVRILITYRHEIADIAPLLKKVACIITVALPIPVSIPFIFNVMIDNHRFDKKYNKGKGAYTVKPEEYKTPADFRDRLKERGLYFTEEDAKKLSEYNSKFGSYPGRYNKKWFYAPATMMPVSEDFFYDTTMSFEGRNQIADDDSTELHKPVYVYNAILGIREKEGSLSYAPFARYKDDPYGPGDSKNYPYFADYYIECKILCVNDDIYAVIGVGESWDVRKCFDSFEKPYCMILSEKENITTYFDGKFYPDGGIEVQSGRFEMCPNKTERPYANYKPSVYPVRKVERLDRDSINAVAEELKSGILKTSVEYHFSKKEQALSAKEKE